MKTIDHLVIQSRRIPPGEEWNDSEPGWKVVLMSEGVGYWIHGGNAAPLDAGEVLVLPPSSTGVLRASRLGMTVLHFFYFCPEHLSGLFSVLERLSFEDLIVGAQVRHIPGHEPAAREFAEIALLKQGKLFSRLRLLHLVATIFSEAAAVKPVAGRPLSPRGQLEQVLARLPDSDLLHCSAEELATLCGWSVRHFRRVFRKCFHASMRAKQTELRLEKAAHLLAETRERVADVAAAAGYRHIAFFNARFKKRYGVTPTEWRARNPGVAAAPATVSCVSAAPLVGKE